MLLDYFSTSSLLFHFTLAFFDDGSRFCCQLLTHFAFEKEASDRANGRIAWSCVILLCKARGLLLSLLFLLVAIKLVQCGLDQSHWSLVVCEPLKHQHVLCNHREELRCLGSLQKQ